MRTPNDPQTELGMNVLQHRALAVERHGLSNGLLISPAPGMHPALSPRNSAIARIGGEKPGQIPPRLEALSAGTAGWVADWAGFRLRYAFELRCLGLLHASSP